jgi:peptidyl-prolyl cis-trans isomerase B (cyclophilin B)
MSTNSGTTFMTSFNELYYTFSPTVSDWERQSPAFKELVKITITPLLSTLSMLNYANIDSEQEMLGYGIGIILLNAAIYFAAPAIVILAIKQRRI